MAEENTSRGNIYSANDTLDINELASLNDDISPEFIEQLQNQIAQNASQFTGKPVITDKEDSELFEEISDNNTGSIPRVTNNENTDDNFIKKYKAKINKQPFENNVPEKDDKITEKSETNESGQEQESVKNIQNIIEEKTIVEQQTSIATAEKSEIAKEENKKNTDEIKNLTSGNILEKPIAQEQLDYNESLDYLDNNIKYSKYVIYIDPENKDFIDSLTVKERKNLINRILREQDDIAITKKRLTLIQTIIKHSIIAIVTISIAIPVVYWTINASLEASINNYRRSQTIFKTLYREKGKIKKTQQNY